MRGIVKEFSGVRVLNGVSFRLRRGSVHALMGENGAGKSTLMKILCGMYPATQGEIMIDGKTVKISSPIDAKRLGIAMIHQELSAFHELTVAANMFMNREYKRGFLLDDKRMNQAAAEILADLNISIDPKLKMNRLSVAEMQLVEIAIERENNTDFSWLLCGL